MIKNKPDFKLINIALIVVIVYLLYQTGNLWLGITSKAINIISPFFFAFVLAYALYPFLKYLETKNIPKSIGVGLILFVILAVVALVAVTAVPLLVDQLGNLFSSIITFLKEMSVNHNINLGEIQDTLNTSFNDIIASISKYISNGAINVVSASVSYISFIFIVFSVSIYFLIDMNKIRQWVHKFVSKKSRKAFLYIQRIDKEMQNYLSGFVKILFITIFEYGFAYFIIGHPNAILLGFLAAIAGLVPYFGGIFVNIIAAITASVISTSLLIKTGIVIMILSALDGYVINPLVYGKTNQLHPVLVIFSIFIGGALLGIGGIILSLPLTILIVATINYFKYDIKLFIKDMTGNIKGKE